MPTDWWKGLSLLFFLAPVAVDAMSASLEKIFPVEIRSRLSEPGRHSVIVLSASRFGDSAFEAALRQLTVPAFPGGIDQARLRLIDGYAVRADAQGLRSLAREEGLAALWVIPDPLFGEMVRIIESLDYIVRTVPEPMAVNISLGPPPAMLPLPYREDEPIHLATRKAAEAGKLVVMSAGNAGPGNDTLNPWCLSPSVVCVGAATEDGSRVWEKSSRGRPGDPLYRPGVVAPGVDLLTAHPAGVPKSPEMRAAEKRTGFDRRVPPERRDFYTVVSGTSFAARHVSDAAAQVFFFLANARAELLAAGETDPKIAIFYHHAPLKKRDSWVRDRRWAGTVEDLESFFAAIYPARPDPLVVKQILLDAALPMADFGEHEAGSGFLHQEIIHRYFGKYGSPKPKILSTKVTE